MDAQKLRCVLLLVLCACLLAGVQAQGQRSITLLTPIESSITPGFEESWQFVARDGEVLSFRVERVSGQFDPIVEIRTLNGETLVSNDDYDYPNTRNALIEAFTFPATSSYRVVVRGYAGTGGAYRLTMLPGYGTLFVTERFNAEVNWGSDVGSVSSAASAMRIRAEGVATEAQAYPNTPIAFSDAYTHVSFQQIEGVRGWQVGLILRRQAPLDAHYRFEVNNSGMWRFVRRFDGTETVVGDWRPHPAIVAGTSQFTFAVLAQGVNFDVFYNGQFIGNVTDDAIRGEGTYGISLTTANAIGAEVSIQVDNLLITQPVVVDGQPLFPQRIPSNSNGSVVVRDLQRRNVIPTGGDMTLALQRSSARLNGIGVLRFPLTRGTLYGNMAIGATVTWSTDSSGISGCGLALRTTQAGDDFYLGYVDSAGGYGLAHQTPAGFTSGWYGNTHDIGPGPYHLVLVGNGPRIHYFIEGYYAGALESNRLFGEIGQAVVNFDALNTECQFENVWLWQW